MAAIDDLDHVLELIRSNAYREGYRAGIAAMQTAVEKIQSEHPEPIFIPIEKLLEQTK